MSNRYLLACPACGASVPSDDVQWDGAEGAPTDFGICPKCGTTSEADEWVEAEDAAPQPCAPGRHCERYARGLGGCVAGHCNPPKPTVNSASTPEWAQNGMRAAMVKLSRALGHPNPVDCGAAQCVEATLIELAAERLTRPGAES